MYTVLVTDDEPIVAESIAETLRRNFRNEIAVYSCFSGREAIEQSTRLHPDIVSIDLRMPGINGLEAIRNIKDINPDTEFVILSAYDYSEYVREAMSLGVAEYLIKPPDEEKLCETLRRIMQRIDSKWRERQLFLKQQEQLMLSIPVLEASFCHALASPEDNTTHLASIYSLLAPKGSGGYVMLLYPKWNNPSEEKCTTAYEDIRYHLKHSFDCIVGVVRNMIVSYITGEEPSGSHRTDMEQFITHLQTRLGSDIPILVGLGQYYDRISEAPKSYFEAYCALKTLLRSESHQTALLRFEDSQDAQKLFQLISFRTKLASLDESTQDSSNHLIQQAEDYIAQRYTESIRLEEVARAVNLSKYYFSRFFKEKKGVSFSQYVTQVRVDYAKKLLRSTQLSVKEIAYQSGFRDPNYFSKVFKRSTGLNPSEFRHPRAES